MEINLDGYFLKTVAFMADGVGSDIRSNMEINLDGYFSEN